MTFADRLILDYLDVGALRKDGPTSFQEQLLPLPYSALDLIVAILLSYVSTFATLWSCSGSISGHYTAMSLSGK